MKSDTGKRNRNKISLTQKRVRRGVKLAQKTEPPTRQRAANSRFTYCPTPFTTITALRYIQRVHINLNSTCMTIDRHLFEFLGGL